MRGGLRASALQKLLISVREGPKSAQYVGKQAGQVAVESQGSGANARLGIRAFSETTAARSAATDARAAAQSASHNHPLAMYGAVAAVGLGAMYYFSSSQPKGAGITLADPEPSPLIEHQVGDFEVMDHLGNRFKREDLLDTFSVIFFSEIDHEGRKKRLLQLADAVMQSDRLSNMQHLKPVFVTLKPKEDDVVKMNAMVTDYASALNRKDVLGVRLRGLVGDDNHKLHEWAQNYTVKVKGKPDVSPENATKDDVDDGGDFYFVNPEGEFIASYGPQVTPREMAEEWAEMMKSYKRNHPSWLSPKKVATRLA